MVRDLADYDRAFGEVSGLLAVKAACPVTVVPRHLTATPVATTVEDAAQLTARVRQDVEHWNAIAPHVSARLSLTNEDALHECVKATASASLLVIGRPHGESHLFALTRPVAMPVLREARCPVAIIPAQYGSPGQPVVARRD